MNEDLEALSLVMDDNFGDISDLIKSKDSSKKRASKAKNGKSNDPVHQLMVKAKRTGKLKLDEVIQLLEDEDDFEARLASVLDTCEQEGIEVRDTGNMPSIVDNEGGPTSRASKKGAAAKRPERELSTDPVRMYLRKMGSAPLLDREGEVEIAKRIEAGQIEMLEIVSNSPVAVQTILDLASKIEEGQVRLGEVISDYEDYVGDEDNPEDVEKVLTKIAQLAKLNSQAVTVRAKLESGEGTAKTRANWEKQLKQLGSDIGDFLGKIHLSRRQIERIMGILKSLIMQADKAMRELNREATTHNLSIDELRENFFGSRMIRTRSKSMSGLPLRSTRSASVRLPASYEAASENLHALSLKHASRWMICVTPTTTSCARNLEPSKPRKSWLKPTFDSSFLLRRNTPTVDSSS